MKLNKLMTLSQFIDEEEYDDCLMEDSYMRIVKYNNFLRTPIKKEMFVNELEKPKPIPELNEPHQSMLKLYNRLLPICKESEKKVIFKGLTYIKNGASTIIKLPAGKIRFDDTGYIIYEQYHLIETLSHVSMITNGELETINLEI